MAPVFAQMQRDQVGAGVLRAQRGGNRIRIGRVALLPQRGNVIDVDHGDGLTSRYAHLSTVDVKPGMLVKRGEKIGAVGTSGRSTGPHLHFEVRMLGVAQNPARFLKQGAEFAQLKRR